MSNKDLFSELIHKYINGSLTQQENNVLMQMLDQKENDQELDRILQESLEMSWNEQFWSDEYRKTFVNRLSAKANIKVVPDENGRPVKPAQRIHFLKTTWFRYAAAIILFLGTGAYLWTISKKASQKFATVNQPLQANVAPGKGGAILTLADGTQIALDSLGSGVVAMQNGAEVILKDGSLAYNATGNSSAIMNYNAMTTPKGRQFHLVLPDGSKVWLNAASSIKYPTVFAGADRVVEINGEAFFEVEKNKNKPFKVKVNEATAIDVLGTSFNINSYGNEEAIKTTLVEGSVRVNAYKHLHTLKPGQQAQIYPDQIIKVVSDVDINQIMAWKNGYFDFNKADLQVMMRQLERWYDIDVRYEGNIPNIVFKGQMDRNVQFSDVIRFLTAFGIKTSLQGRTLIISGS